MADWSPEWVKSLPPGELPKLAAEVRERILGTVSRNGGHLASNLGVVELTIALLRVFSPPRDRILFDVSHQAYAYKLLTGRADSFGTLRQWGGISGFQKRSESPCDAFGSGHAGTAISAALGFAAARDRLGGDEHVVAVVGDASISNGVSLEALNAAAATTRRLVVVLNDNEMSISRNVGALSRLFSRLLTAPGLSRAKIAAERFGVRRLRLGRFRRIYRRWKTSVKRLFLREKVLFEDFGFQYIGPVDGHNFTWLDNALRRALQSDRPVLVHVATVKGRGYPPAEENPSAWHGVGAFDVATGRAPSPPPTGHPASRSWSAAFGDAASRLADGDSRVCALTAAMRDGTGLDAFGKDHPDRFFDVGIAEEHEATFAAGLAAAGMRPLVAVYSTFFQRAVDALVHDAALQRLPVVFCLDRAGAVASDGPTHHGVFDIALARPIPGVAIMQPADEAELDRMLRLALSLAGPSLVRYPRGSLPSEPVVAPRDEPMALGRARVLESAPAGPFVAVWALGDMIPLGRKTAALLRSEGIAAELVDARFVKPLDSDLLADEIRRGATAFLSLENAVRTGGLGTAIAEKAAALGSRLPVVRAGWPDDAFVPHAASNADLLARYGLTPEALRDALRDTLR